MPDRTKPRLSVRAIVIGVVVDILISLAVGFVLGFVVGAATALEVPPDRFPQEIEKAINGTGFLLLSLALSCVGTVAGGFTAGTIAKHSELRHAIVVVIVLEIIILLYALLTPMHLWYFIACIVVTPPFVLVGGEIARRRNASVLPDDLEVEERL